MDRQVKKSEDFQIIRAEASDHIDLSTIAIASKRYWGYPEDWINGWIDDLTITDSYIMDNYVFKLVGIETNIIRGFCAFELDETDNILEVAHLWLRPEYIGRGLGRYLYLGAIDQMEGRQIKKIKVIADPNALGFYEKRGFSKVGEVASTPEGRYLPLMEMPWRQ